MGLSFVSRHPQILLALPLKYIQKRTTPRFLDEPLQMPPPYHLGWASIISYQIFVIASYLVSLLSSLLCFSLFSTQQLKWSVCHSPTYNPVMASQLTWSKSQCPIHTYCMIWFSVTSMSRYSLVSSPTIFPLSLHSSHTASLNSPDSLLPQDLCTCYSYAPNSLYPDSHMAHALAFFRSSSLSKAFYSYPN